MTVCILINELLRGGAQRIVLDLVRAVDPKKCVITVVCLKNPDGTKGDEPSVRKEIEALGIEVHSIQGEKRFSLTEAKNLYSFLRKRQFDVLHTFLPYAGTVGRIVGTLAGVKSIMSTQCNLPIAYSKRTYWLDKITLPLAKVWVAATEGIELAYASSYAAYSPKLWKEGRRHFTVVAGVDLPLFDARVTSTNRDAVRRDLGIPEDAQIVLMVARLISWKGHTDLIDSLRFLPDTVHLVLIGWGTLEESLRAQAVEADIAHRIHFLGARSDVPELLAATDVYAQTHAYAPDGSIWRGPNTSQMEACAAGIPSVSTRVPLIETLIEEGITGRLAIPNDAKDIARAIALQLEASAGRDTMVVNARKRVEERYSVDAMVRTHEALYTMLYATA